MRSNLWHASLPASNVLEKIRDLTSDLQAVQNELCLHLALPDGTPRKIQMPVDPRIMDNLGVLKTTVDQFRRVLWFYVEQAEQPPAEEQDLPYAEQTQAKAALPAAPALQKSTQREAESQQPISFFDRLELVIEGYMRPSGPLASYRQKPKSQ